MAIRVKDGVFFVRGLYSGSLTRGDFRLGLGSFSGVNTSGRVKTTVFSFGFMVFIDQPILCHALACTEPEFVHHSGLLCAAAGRSAPIIPSICGNCSLIRLVHCAFLDRYNVIGVYLPLNADGLGDTYRLAQLRHTSYSPRCRSSVMQLLQNSYLQRGQRVSCGGGTVRLHRLHWFSGGGGRVPPIGIITSRTELNVQC